MPIKKAAPKTIAKKAPVKTVSKAPAKKTVSKAPAKPVRAASKPVAKTSTKKAAAGNITPIKTTFNQSQLLQHLADKTELDRKTVKTVLTALEETIAGAACKKGVGTFMYPGWFKIVVNDVPAKKARKGINPFTGEEQVFAARPATVRVKVRPLKKLKDAALS